MVPGAGMDKYRPCLTSCYQREMCVEVEMMHFFPPPQTSRASPPHVAHPLQVSIVEQQPEQAKQVQQAQQGAGGGSGGAAAGRGEVQIGLVAVETSTGEVLYDQFRWENIPRSAPHPPTTTTIPTQNTPSLSLWAALLPSCSRPTPR